MLHQIRANQVQDNSRKLCKKLTTFLFLGSLNAKSPISFCGNNFASGRRHDNMRSAFITGAGGVTSSEILPKRSQSYKITEQECGDKSKSSMYILGLKNIQKCFQGRLQHQLDKQKKI